MFTLYDKINVLKEILKEKEKRKLTPTHHLKILEQIIADYDSAILNMEIREAKTHGRKK